MKILNFFKKLQYIIYSLTILFLLQIAGEFITKYFSLPIPGAVLGMIFLFIGLIIYGKTPYFLEFSAPILLRHLTFFYLPASVAIIKYYDLIKSQWLAIVMVVTVGTIITMVLSAKIMSFASKKLSQDNHND